MRSSRSIIKPIITEKSYEHASYGKYVFEVSVNATKGSIGKEIKDLYGVDVIEVKKMEESCCKVKRRTKY